MNNAVPAEIDAIHGQHVFRKIIFNRFIHPEFPLARFFVVAKKTESLNRTSEIAPFNLISIFFKTSRAPIAQPNTPQKTPADRSCGNRLSVAIFCARLNFYLHQIACNAVYGLLGAYAEHFYLRPLADRYDGLACRAPACAEAQVVRCAVAFTGL